MLSYLREDWDILARGLVEFIYFLITKQPSVESVAIDFIFISKVLNIIARVASVNCLPEKVCYDKWVRGWG